MASLKDWSEITASPTYQNASEDQKVEMQAKYKNAGGVIPQAAPAPAPKDDSVASTVGNFLADTIQSGANTVSHDVARGIAGLVQMGDKAANNLIGRDASSLSAYGRRMEQNADDLYKKRQDSIGDTTGRTVGEVGGRIASDVGSMIVAPEVAIPGIAAREMGNAYANQKEGQESLTDAVNVGGANYIANRLLPGSGSRVAESLLGKSMEMAGTVGRNAAVGAGGGAVVGAANEANNNPEGDLGDVLTGAVEGGGYGAAFGGVFGGASHLLSRGGKAARDVLDTTPENARADIDAESQTIANAKSSDELMGAYANGGRYNAVRGSQILADQGVPLLDSRLNNDAAAQAAFGKTQDDVFKSMDAGRDSATNARLPFVTKDGDTGRMAVTKAEIENKGSAIVKNVEDSLNTAKLNTDDFVKDLKSRYASEGDTNSYNSTINAELAGVDRFQKNLNDYVSMMKRDKGSTDPARQQSLLNKAKQVQDSFDRTPDYFKTHFNENYSAPKGFTEGFNPIAHAAEYNAVYNQLDNMHPNFRNGRTNPTAGRNATVSSGGFIDKVVGTSVDALKSGHAKRALRREQENNLNQVRNLARGDFAAQRTRAGVDDARADMENSNAVEENLPELQYDQPDVPPAVEPAPAPQPDQALVRRPAPRKTEEPVVEETTVTEEPQPVVNPEPDQALVRRPSRPEEPVVEEQPVVEAKPEPDQVLARRPEAPKQAEEPVVQEPEPEPVPEPTPTIDQTLVRRPEQRPTEEPVAEPTQEPEAPTKTPREDMDAMSKAVQAIEDRKLNTVKDQFTTQQVKDQINHNNKNDKEFLKQMRREDVANNVEALNHSVEQVNKARRIREDKQHEINMNELQSWSKDFNIPWTFISDAIRAKGLSHSKVLGINDIKVRAEKAYERSLTPKSDGTVDNTPTVEPVKWNDQRDGYFNSVGDMHPEVQKAVMPMINQAFRAAEKTGKPLTPSESNSLWKKIYNQEEVINKKLGKQKEAEEAKLKAKKLEGDAEKQAAEAEAAEKKKSDAIKAAKQIQDLHDLSVQMDKISSDMKKEFKSDADPKDVQDFIDAYMDRNFNLTRQPLPQGKLEEAYSKARNAALRYSNKLQKDATPAEKEMELSGSTGPLSEANPELEALHKEIDSLKKTINKSSAGDVKEAQDALSGEIVDRAEKALRDGDSLEDVVDAANVLSKVYYGDNSPAGHSLRQYVRMLQKSKSYKDTYPDQPALWLSSEDVANLSKSNSTHANGLKSQIVRTVLGKNPEEVKLMTNAQREEFAKKVDSGELTKKVSLDNAKARAALLDANSGKPVRSRYKVRARRLNLKRD